MWLVFLVDTYNIEFHKIAAESCSSCGKWQVSAAVWTKSRSNRKHKNIIKNHVRYPFAHDIDNFGRFRWVKKVRKSVWKRGKFGTQHTPTVKVLHVLMQPKIWYSLFNSCALKLQPAHLTPFSSSLVLPSFWVSSWGTWIWYSQVLCSIFGISFLASYSSFAKYPNVT